MFDVTDAHLWRILRNGSEVIKSGSMSEWIKYQPQRVGRSPSSLLNNHKMSEQDRVEETALLNNSTYHNTWDWDDNNNSNNN